MTRRFDFSTLLTLRVRREDRAALATAGATRSVDQCRRAVTTAEDARNSHDMRQAALDARFDAVREISHADLHLDRARVLHADLGRDALTADIETARAAVEQAVAVQTTCRAEWHATRARTEALRALAARHRRAAQRRHDARTEDDGAW
ncbi:hypothetical protein [Falsirhodobacter halotolerans]|uniref:hypothetical protein n=1 Tax=Falsirhodobacter halotolerans TaxID=1146892 RepID=UPI001FD51D00|nr:hypothetical protein [Falsirhodobacter halotolerans]MCJ8141067.1 hypothetical protein [Falsirhodobacter halotolerans]